MKILDKLFGNKKIKEYAESLAQNDGLQSKIASVKDDKEVKELINSATDALKDRKLSDEEKKELASRLKEVASDLMSKK